MKTTFTARHFDCSPSLKEFTLSSVEKLEQFFDKILVCDIVLTQGQDDENPAIAELNVKVPKTLINVSEAAPTFEQAISEAVDNAVRQLRKYKTKHFEHY
ncbi:ribosome hibernation-promoting factor, HPF/YfiA family [Rhodohalobacter mucosus]|uniref:Ribosome-associated translation inhibitor RaiA n=1 Tax=Rhodohalobacter mucosus TaxID=2079485 RepID=A0A316TVU4_9BACT|nr:ribosome-associated translation inhibitor RaiA [Rhodohalobacter mucosus]PWN07479.1 ribosome-associated translation inhibitor RaiA [Rhodohalobacter mucosus]